MEFSEILDAELDESVTLEYKDKRADKKSVLKELVALANEDGGKLLYGVRQSGSEFEEIQDVPNYSGFEESIQQMMGARVSPHLDMGVVPIEYDGKNVVGIEVSHQGVLHSVRLGNNGAYFPIRVGSTTDYIDGAAVREFYRSDPAAEMLSDYERWLDEVRSIAHRIVYQFEECDFDEHRERAEFNKVVEEVAEDIRSRLSEAHRGLDEGTKKRMKSLLAAEDKFNDLEIRTYRSTWGRESGAPPEAKIIENMRKCGEEINSAAVDLEEHIDDKL